MVCNKSYMLGLSHGFPSACFMNTIRSLMYSCHTMRF